MSRPFAEFLIPAPRAIALHCTAAGPAQWDSYREHLRPGTRLEAPALAGYDGSVWPLGATVSLEVEARRLLPLLSSRGGPVDLVGHSYGGAVALMIASLWPERVRSVTVYEPVLFQLLKADAWSARLFGEVQRVAADVAASLAAGDEDGAAARFVDYWSGDGSWARVPAERRPPLMRCMPKVCADFGASFSGGPDYGALRPDGPRVTLLTGTESPVPVRRVAQLLHSRLPHARFEEVKGAGHMAPLSRAAAMAPLLFGEHWREPLALAA